MQGLFFLVSCIYGNTSRTSPCLDILYPRYLGAACRRLCLQDEPRGRAKNLITAIVGGDRTEAGQADIFHLVAVARLAGFASGVFVLAFGGRLEIAGLAEGFLVFEID